MTPNRIVHKSRKSTEYFFAKNGKIWIASTKLIGNCFTNLFFAGILNLTEGTLFGKK